MSEQLINHSGDLKRLRDEGYELEIKGGYLIIHHIPYVTIQKQIKYGTLVTDLTLAAPALAGRPRDHTMFFRGETPCDHTGMPLNGIINSIVNRQFTTDITANYFFSSKPPEGNYADYYEKIVTYAEIMCSKAQFIDPTVTAKTFNVILEKNDASVFNYPDTNSSRANIIQLNSKFAGQQIGIIGLGGTGSYVLEFVAKTAVAGIHLFDDDVLQLHNVFRAPGAVAADNLNKQPKKVDYFANEYSKMHKFIKPHAMRITEANVNLLQGLSYVFICVDKNAARKLIMNALLKFNISFVDVGLGVELVNNQLIGTLRATSATSNKFDHLHTRVGAEDVEDVNEYATNIQIAELNALNAILAIVKWKKWSHFYQDCKEEHHTTFTINTGQLLNEDCSS